MLRKSVAVIFGCCALFMVGCSSDDDDSESGDQSGVENGEENGEEPGEEFGEETEEQPGTENAQVMYRISVTNLTPGQRMSPPVVAIHDAGTRLFQLGEEASLQVQAIAEQGNNEQLIDLVTLDSTVSDSGTATAEVPGTFGPDETASIVLETAAENQVLSIVSMIVCTNDGFTGVDSMALPADSAAVTNMAVYYDAGTEANMPDADYWVPFCGGSGENLHEAEGGVIAIHEGQAGTEEFDFVGSDAAASITVERLESTAGTYDFAFTNISTGQPMTPAVVAIHNPSVSLFSVDTVTSDELQKLAEEGSNEAMVASVESMAEVSASGQALVHAGAAGPFYPGETATLTLETDASTHVFSAVNMIVCANDAFTGANSIALPAADETVTLEAVPYNALTENNVLSASHRLAHCGGNGENLHEDENGLTAADSGRHKGDNFDFEGSDPIMMISVTRRAE